MNTCSSFEDTAQLAVMEKVRHLEGGTVVADVVRSPATRPRQDRAGGGYKMLEKALPLTTWHAHPHQVPGAGCPAPQTPVTSEEPVPPDCPP